MKHTLNDSNLRKRFRHYNRKYFKNKLASYIPVSFAKLPKIEMGRTIHNTHTYVDKESGTEFVVVEISIQIAESLKKNPAVTYMTLLHEMVHAVGPLPYNHGKRFQNRMLQLARAGAFKELW